MDILYVFVIIITFILVAVAALAVALSVSGVFVGSYNVLNCEVKLSIIT